MLGGLNLKSEFSRSLTVLVTGTVIAQVINVLASPILTRLYSESEMGELGIYMRAVAFISAVSTLRYELAIPLPNEDKESFQLYRLSLRLLRNISIALTFLVLGSYFLQSKIDSWLFWILVILSSYVVGFINIGTNWSIRKKYFRAISLQKLLQAVGSNTFRVLFGLFSWGSLGLILATLIGYLISTFEFVNDFFTSRSKYPESDRILEKQLAMDHRDFPTINLLHIAVDLGRDLVIAFLIVFHFGKEIFGLYGHAYSMLTLPLKLVGTAISQIFFGRSTEIVNQGGELLPFMRKTLFVLALFSIVPFLIVFFLGEPIFGFVFGHNWEKSGYFAEIMTIWLMFNFLVSPLSTLPLVLRRQKEFFLISLVGSTFQLIGFGLLPFIIGTSMKDWSTILMIISVAQAIYAIIMWLFMEHYAKLKLT